MKIKLFIKFINKLINMSKNWQKDYYYKKAKSQGYRSRAAFKLKQINKRYKIIEKDDIVIDLGACPGGWSQVAKEIVGKNGIVIGVDLKKISPIDGITFIKGNVADKEVINKVRKKISYADVVLSDMSPNISGNYSKDHASSIHLANLAFKISRVLLKNGGNFVVKVFEGDMFKEFFEEVKSSFNFIKIHSPKASRSSSSEVYVIGKGFNILSLSASYNFQNALHTETLAGMITSKKQFEQIYRQ